MERKGKRRFLEFQGSPHWYRSCALPCYQGSPGDSVVILNTRLFLPATYVPPVYLWFGL